MSGVEFGRSDHHNLDVVTQIVMRRLSDGEWNNLYEQWDAIKTSRYVQFQSPGDRNHFYVLVNEVVWRLIAQGVVTPGINAANPELPWFRVTDYGRAVLEAGRLVPHDPAGYLKELSSVASARLKKRLLPTVEEALRCFTSGCHVAATMMLGIASEITFLYLYSTMIDNLKNPAEKARVAKHAGVRTKHRWVLEKYQALSSADRRKLPESLDTTLSPLYDLIRMQRNEIGHPRESLPAISKGLSASYFQMFPLFVADVQKYERFCRRYGA